MSSESSGGTKPGPDEGDKLKDDKRWQKMTVKCPFLDSFLNFYDLWIWVLQPRPVFSAFVANAWSSHRLTQPGPRDINAGSNPQNCGQISRLCPPGCQFILIRFTSLSNCHIKTFSHLHWYCLYVFVNSEWSWFCAKLLGTMQTLASAAIPDASHSKVHVWGHDRYGHPQKLGWKWLASAFKVSLHSIACV